METVEYELPSLSETDVVEPQDDTNGDTELDADDAEEFPTALVAITVKV